MAPSFEEDRQATYRAGQAEGRIPLLSVRGDVACWQLLLKKSDFTSDKNFAEALVRSFENYVGDRVTNPISNCRRSQGLYEALDCQISASMGAPRNSVAS